MMVAKDNNQIDKNGGSACNRSIKKDGYKLTL